MLARSVRCTLLLIKHLRRRIRAALFLFLRQPPALFFVQSLFVVYFYDYELSVMYAYPFKQVIGEIDC